MSPTIDPMANELAQHLHSLEAAASSKPSDTSTDTMHVSGTGNSFYVAYEQLRNAAEYTEDHLLLRRAIERFLRRLRAFKVQRAQDEFGAELITELTQSGYIKNDVISIGVISQIDQSLQWYIAYFWQLRKTKKVPVEAASRWIMQMASTDIERLLHARPKEEVFLAFTHGHFLRSLKRDDFREFENDWTFSMALYAVVHRTLLKSDLATVRYWFLHKSGRPLNDLDEFIRLNHLVEKLYQGGQTGRMLRVVRRYCPTFRILLGIIAENPNSAEAIGDPKRLMALADVQLSKAYRSTSKKLRSALIRSIVFIFITKMLVGLGIEVPYDLMVAGTVAIMPLAINLLFPPAYMALVGFSISTPDAYNVKAIKKHIDKIFYQPNQLPLVYTAKQQETSATKRRVFNSIYAITFGLSFGLLVWLLINLGFNIVQGMVFFVFLSTVSFLGFKLSRTAHEFELANRPTGIIGAISGFLMTPFVRTGQWLSDKYTRINLVTLLLDIAIEMPLKTSIRLLQQWTGFLRDKRDEI
jgi:hypothetical protein